MYLINYNYLNKIFETDLYNYMTDNNNQNKAHVHDNNVNNTVNLNHSRLQVSVPAGSLNNLAGAFSSTTGSGDALGYKVAKNFPGSPTAKLAAGTCF